MADGLAKNLKLWFRQQPIWVQKAASDYFHGLIEVDDATIAEYVALAIDEASGVPAKPVEVDTDRYGDAVSEKPFLILELTKIEGVNRLSSDSVLEIGENQLTIIYGHNGSGKSGYARLLSSLTGKKSKRNLLPNIFASFYPKASCHISTTLGEFEWNAETGPIIELASTQVFDSDKADTYGQHEYSIQFEPPILRAFEAIIEIAKRVRAELTKQETLDTKRLPNLPQSLAETAAYGIVTSLRENTNLSSLKSRFPWSDEQKDKLANLNLDIAKLGSSEALNALKAILNLGKRLLERLNSQIQETSNERIEMLREVSNEAKALDKVALEQSSDVFDRAILKGFGTEEWLQLWESAKKYSTMHAYPEVTFPATEDAACVLCQQPLSADANQRMAAFAKFVTSDLKKRADESRKRYEEHFPKFSLWIAKDDLLVQIPQVLGSGDWEAMIDEWEEALKKRLSAISSEVELSALPKLDDGTLQKALSNRIEEIEKSIETLSSTEIETQKLNIRSKINELEAQQWISLNWQSVENEVDRLKRSHIRSRASQLCSTTDLTSHKKNLTESHSLNKVRERFRAETKSLCGKDIPVDLRSPRGERGTVYTKLILQGAQITAEPDQILSEGEKRAVALAAFLSDATTACNRAPFIFDDPVSSLDHIFERRVADRLVSLSRERQVVVFSHRLTFVNAIEESASKSNIKPNLIYIHNVRGECGKPNKDWPFKEAGLKKRLGQMLDHLALAKGFFESGNTEEFELRRDRLCLMMRESVEQSIELKICGGVVQRFSKEIRASKVRLSNVIEVTEDDCRILDELMTRYSFDLHLQPDEGPYVPPELPQLSSDIERLVSWNSEFDERVASRR